MLRGGARRSLESDPDSPPPLLWALRSDEEEREGSAEAPPSPIVTPLTCHSVIEDYYSPGPQKRGLLSSPSSSRFFSTPSSRAHSDSPPALPPLLREPPAAPAATWVSSTRETSSCKVEDLRRAILTNDLRFVQQWAEACSANAAGEMDAPDAHGTTPLLLAVRAGRLEIARVLLRYGASLKEATSGQCHSLLDEAILTGDVNFVQEVYLRSHLAEWQRWREIAVALTTRLEDIPDFYLEMSWKFGSSNILSPLVKAVTPDDRYRVWKRGSWLRIDSTIDTYKQPLRITRGRITMIFTGRNDVSPASLVKLNHDKRKIYSLLRKLERPTDRELRQVCHHLMRKSGFGKHVDVNSWRLSDLRFEPPARREKSSKMLIGGVWPCPWKAAVVGRVHSATYRKTPEQRRVDLEPYLQETGDGSVSSREKGGQTIPHKASCRPIRVDMLITENFPLKLRQFLPIVEAMTLSDSTMSSLFEIMGTSGIDALGFPVRVKIPVYPPMGVYSLVQFSICRPLTAEEATCDLFGIPSSYTVSRMLNLIAQDGSTE